MKKISLLIFILFGASLVACCAPVSKRSMSTSTEVTALDVAGRQAANNDVAQSEKLGTKWGDEIASPITELDLKRKLNKPLVETFVQYADKVYEGKSVKGISLVAGQISFSVVDDFGNKIDLYRVDQNYYLRGQAGQSYQLVYENSTGKTFEIVASVDGIDVINGREASRGNSGYILSPYETLSIQGFRKNADAVASFTFSKPKDAYVAHSEHGSIKNTGIIGVVVYELKAPKKNLKSVNKYAPPPSAFPADR